jgi:phosphoribosylaminoimidazolecarboxamide formyltransferase/IMP cyclohydrolase
LLKPVFLEIVMAPSYAPDALELLCTKKNLRVLEVDMDGDVKQQMRCTSVNGGLLVQNQDLETCEVTAAQCVTDTKPTEEQLKDLDFTWRIVKHVKSNAIVVGAHGMVLGVGAGQMNRIGSAEIALNHAEEVCQAGSTNATLGTRGGTGAERSGANGGAERGEAVEPLEQSSLVLASDAFFPFDDCVTLAARYGVKAIVQPGGSIRDEDSIRKCNELGIAMLFTGERHFKH